MFFITCFEKIEKSDVAGVNVGKIRTCGYYDNFNDADRALIVNHKDMSETIYDYAVIEYIRQGIFPTVQDRWFYKYNSEKDVYIPIEAPEELELYTNFAIG